jgi:hypothetical protein
MHIPSLIFTASMSMRLAYADFLIITEAPIPVSVIPSFTESAAVCYTHPSTTQNPEKLTSSPQAASWTTSVGLNFALQWPQYTKSLGAAWQSSVTSIQNEVSSFVASAPSNFTESIPSVIADPKTTTTITSKPDWYTALPSDVRSFKEQEFTMRKEVLASVIGFGQSTGTATKTSSVARPTGVANLDLGLAGAALVAAGAIFL